MNRVGNIRDQNSEVRQLLEGQKAASATLTSATVGLLLTEASLLEGVIYPNGDDEEVSAVCNGTKLRILLAASYQRSHHV